MRTTYVSATTVNIGKSDMRALTASDEQISINGDSDTLNLNFDSTQDLITFTQMLLKAIRGKLTDPSLRNAYVYSGDRLPDLLAETNASVNSEQ